MSRIAPTVVSYFGTAEMERFARLSLHMVNYLCRHEILVPTLSAERRRGLRRRFSYADLLLARAVSRLLESGVSIVALRRALQALRRQVGAIPLNAFAVRHVAIVGQRVYLSEPGKSAVDLSADGQLAFHFVLDSAGLLPERVVRKGRRAVGG